MLNVKYIIECHPQRGQAGVADFDNKSCGVLRALSNEEDRLCVRSIRFNVVKKKEGDGGSEQTVVD